MKNTLITFIFIIVCNIAWSQSNLYTVVLEKEVSDVFKVNDMVFSKVHVFGNQENIIKFLISDKYVNHQIGGGIIYNFILSKSELKANQLDTSRVNIYEDKSKILIVASDTASYNLIYNESGQSSVTNMPNTFKLAIVNNLHVLVTRNIEDTAVFANTDDIVRVSLGTKKGDMFQIDGKTIPNLMLYGLRENIIRFLINDQYIRHKMETGTNYSFSPSGNISHLLPNSLNNDDFNGSIVVLIPNKDEFIAIYNAINSTKIKSIKKEMYVELPQANSLKIFLIYTDLAKQ